MHLDVQYMRHFYYRTRLGHAARKGISDKILNFWPEARGQNMVGFGFATPFLRPYLDEAKRVIALMPGPQGVTSWPNPKENVSVLCQENLWPVDADSVDRLLVLHGLETSELPIAFLDECYRVLAPEGRAIFVVPNRAGLWSRRDATPFGFGRPYSLGQLEAMLAAIGLKPVRHVGALFAPPVDKRFWLKTGPMWEKIGTKVSNRFAGGVLIVEVTKQIPAPPRTGLPAAFRRPLDVLEGIAKPEPKPI